MAGYEPFSMGFLSVFSRLIAIFLRMNHQLTPGDQVEEQATVAETQEVLRQSAACLPIAACEAETHFRQLSWQLQLQGRRNREVLLQEYLKGTQYVVDHVSRDGVHKTTMVWVCCCKWQVWFC